MRICRIEDCDRPARESRTICRMHQKRWENYGSYDLPPFTPGYRVAHKRISAARGKARDHQCECGDQAAQWAYQHNDPNELVEDGKPYSTDIECYKAMCWLCHAIYDRSRLRKVA